MLASILHVHFMTTDPTKYVPILPLSSCSGNIKKLNVIKLQIVTKIGILA